MQRVEAREDVECVEGAEEVEGLEAWEEDDADFGGRGGGGHFFSWCWGFEAWKLCLVEECCKGECNE